MTGALPKASELFADQPAGLPKATDLFKEPERLPPSKPFLERLGEGAEGLNAVLKAVGTDANTAFSEGARKGFGSEPLGLGPESEKWLRENGIIADPANGKGGPLRLLNEALIRPAVTALDFLDRGIKAGVGGISSVIGKRTEQVTGDETAGKQAKRDAENFMNWVLLEGGGTLHTLRVTPSGLQEIPLGGLPFAEDFMKVADILETPKSKDLLRKLYEEHGIHPAEVAADAMGDVTIAQDLAGGRLPGYYVKNPELLKPREVPEAQNMPPQGDLIPSSEGKGGALVTTPDGKPSFDDALAAVDRKINRDGPPKDPMTFDKLYTRLVDDLHPIKLAAKEAGELGIEGLPGIYDLYRLTRGVAGKAEQMVERATFDFATYGNNGRGLKKILEPVSDDIRLFGNYIAAKRALELEAKGIQSGMGDVNPAAVVAELEARSPKYAKALDELVGFQNRISLYLRDAGLISKAGYKAMIEANKNYVPFHRFTDPEFFTKGAGKGFSARNPLKRIEGHAADIEDPLTSIIKNVYAYVQIAERNAANLKLIQLLKKWNYKPGEFPIALPKPGAEGVIYAEAPSGPQPEGAALRRAAEDIEGTPTTTAQRFREAGEPVGEPVPLIEKKDLPVSRDAIDAEFEVVFEAYGIKDPELRQVFASFAREPSGNEIFAFENGKRVSVAVQDAELLAAWRGLDRHSATFLEQLFAPSARVLRAGVTLDTAFVARNILQDLWAAMVNSKGFIFSPIDTARGAAGYLKKDVDFQNWLKGGGANGTMVSLDRRYELESISKLAKDTGFLDHAWNAITLQSPLRGLQMMSEFAENATRLGEFKKLAGVRRFGGVDPTRIGIDKGVIQSAAMASREVTLDFARIGAQMRGYSMATAFLNANIQGTDRFFRALKDNPGKSAIALLGGVSAPSMFLWWANHKDQRYIDLHDWEKDLYWHFMTKDTIFRMRKPVGPAGVFFGAGVERALDAYFNENPEAYKAFEKSIVASLLPNFIPTMLIPGLEQATNTSAMSGGPVVPASLEHLLPEYQYSEYTSEIAKKIGSIMGAFPGMRERAADKTALGNGVAHALTSPELIENYVRGWTGSLGVNALALVDAGLRHAGVLPDPPRPEDTLADLPFMRSFATRYPSAGSKPVSDFYAMEAENESVMNTIQARAKAGDQTAVEEIVRNYDVRIRLDELKQTLSDMAVMARGIYKNPEMTPQDKRQMLDTIFMRRTEFARYGVEILKADKARRDQNKAFQEEIEAYERQRKLPPSVPATDPRRAPIGGGLQIEVNPAPKPLERPSDIVVP